jgi:hypothetical protein
MHSKGKKRVFSIWLYAKFDFIFTLFYDEKISLTTFKSTMKNYFLNFTLRNLVPPPPLSCIGSLVLQSVGPDPSDTDPDPAFHFDTNPDPSFQLIWIWIRLFDTDLNPGPYPFKEVMNLKQYFLYIFSWFSLSVGPTRSKHKAYFVKFSLPVNFVLLIREAYGSGS